MNRQVIINELNKLGYEVKKHETIKNGLTYKGILIKNGTNPLVPLIYTDLYIKEIVNGYKSLKEVIEEIIEIYENKKDISINLDTFISKEFILKNVYVGIQKETSQDILKRPIEDFEGLEMYLYIRGEETIEDGFYSMKLEQSLISKFGISEDEIFNLALQHTIEESTIRPIQDIINEMLGINDNSIFNELCSMCVVSNGIGIKGASAILNKDLLKQYANLHKVEKLVILPSSIHECIVLPYMEDMIIEELTEMVKSVNENEVAPTDKLIDKAYLITI